MAGLLFTTKEIENIIDELLNMDPDPIPRFILLKEGKGLKPSDREYQNAYAQVLAHPFTRQIVRAQTPGGLLGSFSRRFRSRYPAGFVDRFDARPSIFAKGHLLS